MRAGHDVTDGAVLQAGAPPDGTWDEAIWAERVDMIYAGLNRAAAAVRSLPEPEWTAVRSRLDQELEDARAALDQVAGQTSADGRFEAVLAEAVKVEELAEECLELAAGAAARTHEDESICRLADRLVGEVVDRLPVARWPTLCVPGPADRYSRRTKVITVGLAARVGADGFWGLPAVAHELGHHVAPLVTREAGTTVLHDVHAVLRRAAAEDPSLAAHLSELFADCFAAWVLGPAYALWAARAGFGLGVDDPEPSDTHPGAEVRVRQIVRTTRALSGGSPPADVSQRLADLSPARVSYAAEYLERTDAQCDRLRVVLSTRLTTAQYAGWHRAVGLAAALGSTDSLPQSGTHYDVVDVVNAAWWARVKRPERLGRITERAWDILSANDGGQG